MDFGGILRNGELFLIRIDQCAVCLLGREGEGEKGGGGGKRFCLDMFLHATYASNGVTMRFSSAFFSLVFRGSEVF